MYPCDICFAVVFIEGLSKTNVMLEQDVCSFSMFFFAFCEELE